MHHPKKLTTGAVCPLEVRIPENFHSVITAHGEGACFHVCLDSVVGNSGRQNVAIAQLVCAPMMTFKVHVNVVLFMTQFTLDLP